MLLSSIKCCCINSTRGRKIALKFFNRLKALKFLKELKRFVSEVDRYENLLPQKCLNHIRSKITSLKECDNSKILNMSGLLLIDGLQILSTVFSFCNINWFIKNGIPIVGVVYDQ